MYIHPTAAEYTLFLSEHGTVSITDPEIGQKSHRKFRNIKIKPSVFSDHSGMKLEINIKRESWEIYRRIDTKQHTLKLNNTLLKNPVGQRRNQKGNSNNIEKEMKMDIPHTKT